MSRVEELLKDNKLTEKLSMAKLNDLLKKEEEEKKPSKVVIIFAIIGVLERALRTKGWQLHAAYSVQMRNTYVCLPGFDTDTTEVENQKAIAANKCITQIAEQIKSRKPIKQLTRGSMAWLKTYVLRPVFNALLTTDRHFHVEKEKCTGCGLCVKRCPLGNMQLNNMHHPQWNGHCTGCLRCYHICPKHAIEYGKFTRNKGQVKINF